MPSSSSKREFVVHHPNIWVDDLSTYLPHFHRTNDFPVGEEHDEMKQEIRSMLLKNTKDPCQILKLIDIVQRLGIAYHFNGEIENQLTKIFNVNFEDYHNDLCHVALRFRLLRQQGFNVSCDVFEKFKDEDGTFKATLSGDIEGLLNLYEAAFHGVTGEDILDEAIDFTTKNLNLLLSNLSPNLAKEVTRALNRPIRKNVPRLEARHFIGIYEEDNSHNKTLAKFAKLDFNKLQVLHQKELKDVHEWWKQWDFTTKLPYGRQRIWEAYFWMLAVYFEPQYSEGRKLLAKMAVLFTNVDDTYDNYGKIEELESLTLAIQRWDEESIAAFPENLQIIFQSLATLINEIGEIATREGKPFYTYYAKKFIDSVVENYLTEVKWRDAEYVPAMEEYMAVSTVTICYPMLTTVSFTAMGEIATKETFEWISTNPKSVKASATIFRLMDDIVSHKFEQESRDHVASAVECHMKQYKTSEEESIKMLKKEIENAWKDINKECLRPLPVAMDILERALNFARVADVCYKEADGYTNPLLIKDIVASVLKDPIL